MSMTKRAVRANFLAADTSFNGWTFHDYLMTPQSLCFRSASCSHTPLSRLCTSFSPVSSQYQKWTLRQQSAPFHDLSSTAAVQTHRNEVSVISKRVRDFHHRDEKFRIFHGSTNSTRKSAVGRDPKKVVDTSRLSDVLYIDAEKQTAVVQPNVPMDRLVEATLEHGLVPPVVMEFPGITVGGGYSGTSGESSSFQHGFFDKTLNRVEMVLANGEVIVLSKDEYADLFHGAAGAVGTFGVTTLVEIQLRKAAKFVETTYHPVTSMGEAIRLLQSFTSGAEGAADYVDGVMYSQNHGAIVTGRLTDNPESTKIQRFSHASDPWYYLHVQDIISKQAKPTTEAIPLPEYLFRYDRGGFWVGQIPFRYFNGIVPFNSFTRWWLDDFLHTRMLYKALHGSGQDQNLIIQDLALPYETAEDFVRWTDERFGIWPLWLCPLKQSPHPTMHPHVKDANAQMLNIGLWGMLKPGDDAVQANRDLERRLRELGGMKWLYAQTYYSEDEFWGQFDHKWYKALRNKYSATKLPSVYDKVKVNVDVQKDAEKGAGLIDRLLRMWPFAGFYGLRKAIQSKAYLQARNSTWPRWMPRS